MPRKQPLPPHAQFFELVDQLSAQHPDRQQMRAAIAAALDVEDFRTMAAGFIAHGELPQDQAPRAYKKVDDDMRDAALDAIGNPLPDPLPPMKTVQDIAFMLFDRNHPVATVERVCGINKRYVHVLHNRARNRKRAAALAAKQGRES